MAWVRLDDRFYDNPKIIGLSDQAVLLYISALCYSSGQLTDGFIPEKALRRIGWRSDDLESDVTELVNAGLWEPTDGGYMIHDYLEYNPSREELEDLREKRSQAGRRGGMASAAKRQAKSSAIDEHEDDTQSADTQANTRANAEARAEANAQANAQADAQAKPKQNSTPNPNPIPNPIPNPNPYPDPKQPNQPRAPAVGRSVTTPGPPGKTDQLDPTGAPGSADAHRNGCHPPPEEAERSFRLLTDPEVGLGEKQAMRLARVHAFPWLLRQVFAWRRDLEAGRVSGPGALVSRCDRHFSAGELTERDRASPLYRRYVSEADEAEERRRRYIPDEYADLIEH